MSVTRAYVVASDRAVPRNQSVTECSQTAPRSAQTRTSHYRHHSTSGSGTGALSLSRLLKNGLSRTAYAPLVLLVLLPASLDLLPLTATQSQSDYTATARGEETDLVVGKRAESGRTGWLLPVAAWCRYWFSRCCVHPTQPAAAADATAARWRNAGLPSVLCYQSSSRHTIVSVSNSYKQEAELSLRDRATLRVIKYFAKSLKITQAHSKRHCSV